MSTGTEFAWISVVPTLVGGGISLATTVAMFRLAQKVDQKKKASERRRIDAMAAYAGLQKLIKSVNFFGNLNRHIDELFLRAQAEGIRFPEPASVVVPILNAPTVIEDLTPEESRFLIDKDGEFLARVVEIQERARALESILNHYNRIRAEYDVFLESKVGALKNIDGSVVSFELEGADSVMATIRIGRLNQVVVGMVTFLERDTKASVEVCVEYVRRAREAFGDDFPVVEFKVRSR